MLESTWFFLWGLLWAVYFVLDGFDFGMGACLPFLAKNDDERRLIYNAAGPYWDGNEVWLITAGGVTFAAFPTVYAVMFSTLYAPLLMLLFALIFRAVSYEFRSKKPDASWRRTWDVCQVLGNFLPALLLGVFFANLFMGVPFDGDGVYHGNLFKLLNPYGLAGGVVFVLMFCVHGNIWLALKTGEALHHRAVALAKSLWIGQTLAAVAMLVLTAVYTNLYANYLANPVLFIVPALAVCALLGVRLALAAHKLVAAFALSALHIVSLTFFGLIGMFPNLYISSLDPSYSLGIHNAASSPLTLTIMLVVVLVCIPVVIAYQVWVYSLFAYKVTIQDIHSAHHAY